MTTASRHSERCARDNAEQRVCPEAPIAQKSSEESVATRTGNLVAQSNTRCFRRCRRRCRRSSSNLADESRNIPCSFFHELLLVITGSQVGAAAQNAAQAKLRVKKFLICISMLRGEATSSRLRGGV